MISVLKHLRNTLSADAKSRASFIRSDPSFRKSKFTQGMALAYEWFGHYIACYRIERILKNMFPTINSLVVGEKFLLFPKKGDENTNHHIYVKTWDMMKLGGNNVYNAIRVSDNMFVILDEHLPVIKVY